jgi:hypothetical protein
MDPERTDPNGTLSDFLSGLENHLSSEKRILGPVYRPGDSEVSGTAEPPEEMTDPVFSPDAGWIDRGELGYEPMVWINPSEVAPSEIE